MRLLVTGATGRIGQQVVKDVPDGIECWTTSRTESDRSNHVVADLTVASEVAEMIADTRPEVVIHLAGTAGADRTALFEANVMGTVNLIQEVQPGSRVVVVGSAAEYGAPTSGRASEDTPLHPVSAYGWSKVEQTRLARSIGVRRGVEIVVARPFNVVSPSMDTTTPVGNIADQFLDHQGDGPVQLLVGRLDIVRDFIPVTFVGAALLGVALTTDVADTYNICSGHGFTLQELVDAMASLRDADVTVGLDPKLASIPAVDGIVGDPRRIAGLLGQAWEPSITVLASVALDRDAT